ncbi:neurogenic locus notch homolog protein 1-like [Haliotis rufescens]|uniref:neurogenic locus notch homolog protein 1-like n=1 Tax=Haliotis rufescens TaxID=6454 RepID=UPI00201E7DE8|nr:neurogenic locus notch homolog protein 1-like [Haliotis rufescens]
MCETRLHTDNTLSSTHLHQQSAMSASLFLLLLAVIAVESSDPCSNFTLFQKLDQRQSTFTYAAPGIDDSKLTPGWYGIPTKWKLLESAPKTRSCGTRYPLWKSGLVGEYVSMCITTGRKKCYKKFQFEMRQCDTVVILHLTKVRRMTGFCLENIDPCRKNPCLNGGTCQSQNERYICSCLPKHTGPNCEKDGIEDMKPRVSKLKKDRECPINSPDCWSSNCSISAVRSHIHLHVIFLTLVQQLLLKH